MLFRHKMMIVICYRKKPRYCNDVSLKASCWMTYSSNYPPVSVKITKRGTNKSAWKVIDQNMYSISSLGERLLHLTGTGSEFRSSGDRRVWSKGANTFEPPSPAGQTEDAEDKNFFRSTKEVIPSSRVARNDISLNLAVQTLVHFIHNSSCSSKHIQTKDSYWLNCFYFHW